MSRYCDNCLHYSDDDKEICPHCGELLPPPETPEDEDKTTTLSLGNVVGALTKIIVAGLVIYVAYNRYSEQLQPALQSLRAGNQGLIIRLLGIAVPYIDYIVMAIGLSMFFWFMLWLVSKMNK